MAAGRTVPFATTRRWGVTVDLSPALLFGSFTSVEHRSERRSGGAGATAGAQRATGLLEVRRAELERVVALRLDHEAVDARPDAS